MDLTSRVLYILGDHIDTDLISPSKYMTDFDPRYLATIALRDAYPDFREKMSGGGILVAGKNFGCGSSRETAPIALKEAGVLAIIADEFARIFYRNAINIGLPCIICPGIQETVAVGDELRVNFVSGRIENLTTGAIFEAAPIPDELINYFEAGGLINYLEQKLRSSGNDYEA